MQKLLGILPDNIDLQVFEYLPIYIRVEVLKGEILYLKDFQITHEIAIKTIQEYEDFAPYYFEYINNKKGANV